MVDLVGVDWVDYVRSLRDDEAFALAAWLAAEGLEVGEFREIVDRAYAVATAQWHEWPRAFVTQVGRPVATAYARRKRCFSALDEAMASGAMRGDVAPEELQMPAVASLKRRRANDLLQALERIPLGGE